MSNIKSNCSLSFIELSIAEKDNFGSNVIAELTANAGTFPNLPHLVIVLTATNTDLRNKAVAALSGDHQLVAAMHIAEELWNDQFRDTAIYVTAVADGNEETIRKGGFVPTKGEREPAVVPTPVEDPVVMPMRQQGAFSASCKPMRTAKGYAYIAAPVGAITEQVGNVIKITIPGATPELNKTVCVQFDTHRAVVMTGLPSEVAMNVQIAAINTAGTGALSTAQRVVPQ